MVTHKRVGRVFKYIFRNSSLKNQARKKCYYLYKKIQNTLTSGNVIPVCDVNTGDRFGSKEHSDSGDNVIDDCNDKSGSKEHSNSNNNCVDKRITFPKIDVKYCNVFINYDG